MKIRPFHLPLFLLLASPGIAQAHEADTQSAVLGTVSFRTSCDPKVQKDFDRAVAMLHSFWYQAGEDAFRDILKKDPQCAIATWGIAYLKAAAVLEDQFKKHPDHPGVAHYLIHCYDAPPIADKGVTAARLYAGIAPAAPHALHMPSHIFTRVGYWQESISTNARSMEVAKPAGDIDEAYHAADYMVYADLQLARDAETRRAIDEALKMAGASPRFVAPYAIAASPARYVFE